ALATVRTHSMFGQVVPSSASGGTFGSTTTTTGGGSFTGGSTGGASSVGGEVAAGPARLGAPGAPADQAIRGPRTHDVSGSSGPTTVSPRITKQEPALAQVIKTASLDLVLPRGTFSDDFQKATGI